MIQIRPSQLSDLDRLMEIFDHARKFMASVGNGNPVSYTHLTLPTTPYV